MKAEYKEKEHKIVKGLYGTFESSPFEEYFKERLTRKISYTLQKIFKNSKPKNVYFVVGAGRSGTSVLLKSLSEHPKVLFYSGEALDLWFPNAFPWKFSDKTRPPFWLDPKMYSLPTLNKWKESDTKKIKGIFGLYQKMLRKEIFINKNAMAAYIIEHMNNIFPEAKFIYIVRDGRAVALSHAEQMYARIQKTPEPYKEANVLFPFNEMLKHTSKCWNDQVVEYQSQFINSGLKNEERLFEIKYEEFCASPNSTLNKMTEFLNLGKPYEKTNLNIRSTTERYKRILCEEDIAEMESIMEMGLKLHKYI